MILDKILGDRNYRVNVVNEAVLVRGVVTA